MAPKQQRKRLKNRALGNASAPTNLVNPFEEKWARSRNAAAKRQARRAATEPSANKFIDKRIAEHDPTVSDNDRYLLRLQRERSNRHKRAAQFNLEDHDDYGDEVEEDGDDGDGGLDPDDQLEQIEEEDEAELFTRKKPRLDENVSNDGRVEPEPEEDLPKSKQEVMHELIQKSKVHKAEKQREKHHVSVETLRLDTGLQDIMELLNKAESDFDAMSKKAPIDKPPPPAVSSDDKHPFQYEAAYNMLAQEKRARPSQRLLTEEERAEHERERLIELERLRKQRMNTLDDSVPDGEVNKKQLGERAGADDITDSFNDTTDGGDSVDSGDNRKEGLSRDSGKVTDGASQTTLKQSVVWSGRPFWETYSEKQIFLTTEREIPFMFEKCPTNVAELAQLFENATAAQRADIVDRLRKCFAISLDPGRNRSKMARLTECLLFWVERLCEVSEKSLSDALMEMDALLPHIHALGTSFEQILGTWAANKIGNAAASLENTTAALSASWTTSEILVLRCISQLYPSSDLRHGVMTPLRLLLSEALSSMRIHRTVDIAYGVFVAYILIDVLAARKEFSPELIQFVCAVLGAFSDNANRIGEGTQRDNAFSGIENTVTKTSPLSLKDCVRMRAYTLERNERLGLAWKILNGVVSMVEVLFDGWVPHADIVLAQVDVNRISPEWARKRIEAVLKACEKERSPLSLYTKRERVVVKAVNPRMRSSETGVFHKNGRSIPGIAPSMSEAAAAARRVRKALRKEVRGLARDVKTEADVAAGNAFAQDIVRRKKAAAKDKEIRSFFEHQRSTWRAADKQQRKLSRKRW